MSEVKHPFCRFVQYKEGWSVPFLYFCKIKKSKSLVVSRILLTFALELEQTGKNGCGEDSNE